MSASEEYLKSKTFGESADWRYIDKIKQGLILEKTIYPKKQKFDQKLLVKILELEIQTHVRKFPELTCKDIDKPKKNNDGSMLYVIHFEKKGKMNTPSIIKTYKCVDTKFNHNMGVTECWCEYNTIFHFDRNGWIKAGDEVKIEVNEKNVYERIWVNGELKTTINKTK